MEINERIDNTIQCIYEVLKDNANTEKTKKALEDLKKLKERRNIK